MSTNTSLNKRIFMNKPPSFDGEGFTIWKEKMKMLLDVIDFDLWAYVQNDSFVLTHFINNEVVTKPINLWTVEEKEKNETKL